MSRAPRRSGRGREARRPANAALRDLDSWTEDAAPGGRTHRLRSAFATATALEDLPEAPDVPGHRSG